MATQGVNVNVHRVRWRPLADSVVIGLSSDIWEQGGHTISAIEFPSGFPSTAVTFQGSYKILPVSTGSDLTSSQSDPSNAMIRDGRYQEDLGPGPVAVGTFFTITDEAGADLTLAAPGAAKLVGLDDLLAGLAAPRYLRMLGDVAPVSEIILRVYTKEP